MPVLKSSRSHTGSTRPSSHASKSAVDEDDYHAMGVIGVHGKPGMRGTAAVLEKTTLVVAFAVSELSVLLCNLHGLQVRKLVEVTTDSFGLAMHFEAELSVTADVATVCKRLVEFLPKSLAELSSSAMHAATVVCGGRYVWWASIERAEAMALETNANRVIKALRARVARKAGLSTDVAAPRQPAPTLRAPTAMLKTVARSSYCHQAQLLARLGPRLGANDVVCEANDGAGKRPELNRVDTASFES